MAPGGVLTICATALPPSPARAGDGQVMGEEVPSFHALAAASTRYWEKFCVVPEESDLTARVIVVLGRLTPELRALIAGSSQVLIVPWKIPASTVASSFRLLTLGRL